MTIRVDNRARVRVASWGVPGSEIEFTRDLISVSTTKDAGSGAGSYQIELYPANAAATKLRPGDWCEIYYETIDGDELAMWGPISQVQRRRTATGTGSVQQRLYLYGRDFMRVLESTEVIFDSILWEPEQAEIIQKLYAQGALTTQKAGPFVRTLIKTVLQHTPQVLTQGQFVLPNKKSILEYTGTSLPDILGNRSDDDLCLLTQPSSQITTLLRLCEQFADLPNNYFYGDIRPGDTLGEPTKKWAPAIILDRHPYSLEDFMNLPVTEVDATDAVLEDIGWHDQDIRNWYQMSPENLGSAGDTNQMLVGPDYDVNSIARHGLRRWDHRTNYVFPTEKDYTFVDFLPSPTNYVEKPNLDMMTIHQVLGGLRKQLTRARTWYGTNDALLNGSLSLKLTPKIRPMTRLQYHDSYTGETLQFLVEAVAHYWSYSPATSGTQVSVSRGYIVGQFPTAPAFATVVRT